MFGAHLPGTKIMVIKTAASRVSTTAPHKIKIYPCFIFPLKMYAQSATVVKLIHIEIIYTRNENKCI
jgi:hypothetical protein